MVEFLLKALLRGIGVEVPKIQDAGKTLGKRSGALPPIPGKKLSALKRISNQLRKEWKLSFDGADVIPTHDYEWSDAQDAINAGLVPYSVEKAMESG